MLTCFLVWSSLPQGASPSPCPDTDWGSKLGDTPCLNTTWNCVLERKDIKSMGLSHAIFSKPGKGLQPILYPVTEIAITSSLINCSHTKGETFPCSASFYVSSFYIQLWVTRPPYLFPYHVKIQHLVYHPISLTAGRYFSNFISNIFSSTGPCFHKHGWLDSGSFFVQKH